MENEDTRVYIEIPPSEVNYVNRIIEGYEYLGVLTSLDAMQATCHVNSPADTRNIVIDVLTHLPDVKVKILSNREEALRDLKK